MQTILDLTPDKLSDGDQRYLSKIRTHEFAIMHVGGEDGSYDFSYSTGIWKRFNQPELIIFAARQKFAHWAIWHFWERMEKGERFSASTLVSGCLEDFEVALCPVSEANRLEHMTWTDWFYQRAEFPAAQIVLPNLQGHFPWQKDEVSEAYLFAQPDLSGREWVTGP